MIVEDVLSMHVERFEKQETVLMETKRLIPRTKNPEEEEEEDCRNVGHTSSTRSDQSLR